MRTVHRIRRVIAVALLMTYLPACFHYVTPAGGTPEEYIAKEEPDQIRVTLADASIVFVRSPYVSEDSLGGHRIMADNRRTSPWTVPLDTVQRVEVLHQDKLKTALIVVPLAPAAMAALYAATDGFGQCYWGCD